MKTAETILIRGIIMKKIVLIFMGVIDAILLSIIIISLSVGWRIGKPSDPGSLPVESKHTDMTRDVNEVMSEKPEESNTEPETETEDVKEPETEAAGTDKNPETETLPETAEATKTPSEPSYPSAVDLSTNGVPEQEVIYDGFRWNREDGPFWENLAPDAIKLTDFEAVRGGWKAYILDDPGMDVSDYTIEHYLNIDVSGNASSAVVTLDWSYTFNWDEGAKAEDGSPDTVFSGDWSEGALEAYGAGMILLKDFYFDGATEYAVGTLTWPDGVDAIIAVVRP